LHVFSETGLRDSFQKWFEIVPARTEALKDEAYRLRHGVYCEDLAFEPRRSDQREMDAFDAQSSHLLVRHRKSQQFVGCVRLVHLPLENPLEPLPLERVCGDCLSSEAIPADPHRRQYIAEVSRLAIARQFRRRRGEAKQAAPLAETDYRGGPVLRFPYILTGLYLGVVATAALQDLRTLFMLTEPRLADHLRTLGIPIVQIGPEIEHRGVRVPSSIEVQPMVQSLNRLVRPFYEHVLESVKAASVQHAL
jgi:N-acyl amino acid synthase of PEP-CTERM/exosortase system